MTETQNGFIEANGAQLYYELAGTGRPFVMLHGHLIDSGQWDDQFMVFAKQYQVVRFDARGFGQSTLPPEPFAYHEDLAEVLRFLNIERAILIGCSGGGATIIDFALTYPEMVTALILVGTAVDGYRPIGPIPPQIVAMNEARQSGDVDQAVELSLQALTDGPRRAPHQVHPVARARTKEMSARLFVRSAVPDAVQQMLDPPSITHLAEIKVPTLVMVGKEDQAPLHEIAEIVTSQIADAQKVVIADAGHHPNLEHPETFNRVIKSFLQQAR